MQMEDASILDAEVAEALIIGALCMLRGDEHDLMNGHILSAGNLCLDSKDGVVSSNIKAEGLPLQGVGVNLKTHRSLATIKQELCLALAMAARCGG